MFLPEQSKNPPLVVFIHGGGWNKNSYRDCKITWLTEHGFAVASVGYRLSQKAIFPAQIHDVKGAVRWLRAHAKDYGYDATRIGVVGTSAGGHLASLLGVSGGMEALEGDTGGNPDQSSRVHAVVDFYGPTDFILRSKNQPKKTEQEGGGVFHLLGGKASEKTDLARLASPVFHVSKDDPPLLALHGDKDTTVYLDQSERIVEEYGKAGLEATLITLPGAGHGRGPFFEGKNREKVVEFLNRHLRK
ncbi:alpha/beta hydrolase [Novipirellula artificiosorum]|uniref:alpha/beta hydrolase n=1 Tax=Novipirellula artificiosorum TaxID=2528016 RepID=UPI001E2A7071|nr:alpha/beta hydrolase [Novipirellula artificiosorum]